MFIRQLRVQSAAQVSLEFCHYWPICQVLQDLHISCEQSRIYWYLHKKRTETKQSKPQLPSCKVRVIILQWPLTFRLSLNICHFFHSENANAGKKLSMRLVIFCLIATPSIFTKSSLLIYCIKEMLDTVIHVHG